MNLLFKLIKISLKVRNVLKGLNKIISVFNRISEFPAYLKKPKSGKNSPKNWDPRKKREKILNKFMYLFFLFEDSMV